MKSLSKRAISLILAVLMIMDVFTPVAVVASTNSPQNNVHVLDEVPESETNSQNNDILIPAKPQTNPEEDTLVPAEVPGQNSSQNSSQKPAQKPVQNNKTPNQLYKSWTLVNPGKTTYAKGDILDLSQLSVRVTKEDGTVTTLSYVQLLKDTNFDIIENVGNKINLQPGKGSVTLVGPSLNPITVNIVVNDSADKLQGTNSKDELVPAIDPQAKEENDELVVAENPNDKKTNIIEGNEQNSPEKDKLLENEKDALEGTVLAQVAGKETEGNPSGLPAFDPLKALGLNKEDRELTEEELEAGLTKVELPTLNEAPVSPVFARSTYQSTGLIGDANLKEDLGLDMSDEIVPEAVGAGNTEDLQNVLQLDGKKFNIRTNFQTKVANGPIRAGQYFNIKLDDKLTLKDKFSLQPIKYNGQVIATAKYNAAENTITYKLIADIIEDISVPVNIPVDYNTQNIAPDENGNFVVINKISGLGVINPKDFNPKKVNKFGNVTNQITEPGRKEVTEIIESGDKEHKVYLEEWSTPVIEDKNLVGFNWTFTVTSDTDLNSLGYRANFTTVKGSGLGEIKDVKINGQDVELTDQLQNGLGIVDSKHHTLEVPAEGITYTFYTEVTDKQSAYMVDFSLALTAQNKVGAKRCIADEGYNLDDIAVATTSRVGMNNRTTILGEFPIIDGAKWTVTDAVSTGDNNEILPLEQRTLGGDQSQTGTQIAVYKLNSDGQMVEDKAAEETIRATEAQETYQVADQPVGTIAAYVYDTAINKDENQPEAKKELTLGGVEIAINDKPLADDSLQMEGSLEVSEKEVPQAVGAGDLNLDGKKFKIRTRFDTSTKFGPIRKGQNFKIHLDDKLKVNDQSSLEPIKYNGKVIATPSYDSTHKIITYTITEDINENIKLPLTIPVDYDINNITLDPDGTFTVINKVTGIGVTDPKALLPEKIDKNGNPAGTIIEPGRHDVIQIFDDEHDKSYAVNIDTKGNPVVEDGEMKSINWTIRVHSTEDLLGLGYKLNITAVEGSGLKEIKEVKINGQPVGLSEQLENSTGIVDSKHHSLTESTNDIVYTFNTPVKTVQSAYMLDVSGILTKRNNLLGATRLILDDAYKADVISEATPTRVGMNNRTTIQGKFVTKDTATWTVTDGVLTGDDRDPNKNNGLPWETRTLGGKQTIQNNNSVSVVYGVDTDSNSSTYGQMVVKRTETTINALPKKEKDPEGTQSVGNIAVYKIETSLTDATTDEKTAKDYSLGGVSISKYKDVVIEQIWNLPDGGEMPAQNIEVIDKADNLSLALKKVSKEAGKNRIITIPDVKFWDFVTEKGKNVYIAKKLGIKQNLPTDLVTIGDKQYRYNENSNYYKEDTKTYQIRNSAIESTIKTPANFTVVKVDSKDPTKKLSGAVFYLLGNNGVEVETDANGKAEFKNIAPGTYTLAENKAPEGYKLDRSTKIITVADNGEISVSGDNIQLLARAAKTEKVNHNKYPNWPDYMNTMHYGKITKNGTTNQVEFYIYLKPDSDNGAGGTNRDTRFNISIPGVSITDVTAYDVSPTDRNKVRAAMEKQVIDELNFGTNVINANSKVGTIRGASNVFDNYTSRTGYQIYFPKARFANDWGFLVKVKADIGNRDATSITYDWLTTVNTANETNLTKTINLVKTASDGEDSTNKIIVTNEAFEKSPIKITKFADQFDIDGNRIKLEDAEFALKDSEGNLISNKYAKKDGEVDFGMFPPGTYKLEEVKAPDGYQKSDVYFEVVVNEKGEVSYNAKFEDSIGKPKPGQDFIIEKGEDTQAPDKELITRVEQRLEYQENEPGDIGQKTGTWEAYRYESLKYHADITLSDTKPGTRFEIQFDPNLDFTQYFSSFPKIKVNGVDVADPYFDYNTNLLTYVYNDKSQGGPGTASINLRGIIPSKFYAKETGSYPFTIKVRPKGTNTLGNPVIDKQSINADYERYDTGTGEPSQSYYFRDVYKKEDGNWYVTAISYFNPLGDRSVGVKTLNYNWLTTTFQDQNIARWTGKGYDPLYKLNDIKIYRTEYERHYDLNGVPLNKYMPLSYGIRPEQDPYSYSLVYHQPINLNEKIDRRYNDFRIDYDPNRYDKNGLISNKAKAPLKITTPAIRHGEGYVIEQTFKITDIEKFNKTWRAFYMSNGNLESAFASRANVNTAIGDQTGGEIPKFYKEIVGLINRKYVPGQFKLIKHDEIDPNKKLPNATFALTDEKGNTIYRSSNANGIVDFSNIAPGRYTLEEYKAPDKYQLTNKKWQVIVQMDGSVRILETSITGGGQSYVGDNIKIIKIPVSNKPVGEKFRVYKKDGDGQPLEGAKFKITKPDGTPVFDEVASNPQGIVEFQSLLQEGQTYILEETQAPAGYLEPSVKKWVLKVEGGKVKVYNYSTSTEKKGQKSILGEKGTEWIDVKNRNTIGWTQYDNRWKGWAGNSEKAEYLGTRIIAKNTDEKYVIQRYIINPEGRSIERSNVSIHRQLPEYQNMDWFDETKFKVNTDIKVFTLDKTFNGLVSDLRLNDYNATDITDQVKTSMKQEAGRFGEPQRLGFELPKTTKPIVIDIKAPYKDEDGGVGTGMDWTESGTTYWKADYYENASEIKTTGSTTTQEGGNIVGSYISEGSLDVTNEMKTTGFKLKKVKEGEKPSPIQGAVFKLTGPGNSTDERTVRTGPNGIVSFDGLKPGEYKLVETEPAPGYEKATNTWTVTVSKDGKTYIKEDKETRSASNTTVSVAQLSAEEARTASPISYALKNGNLLFDSLTTEELNRSLAETVMGKDSENLEIGDEIVGQPVGQGNTDPISEYNVDSTNANIKVSAGAVNTTDGSRDVKVKITPKTKQTGSNRSHWILLVDRSKDFSGKNNLDNNINKFLTDLRAKADTPGAEVYISMIEYSAVNNMNKLLVSKKNIKDFDGANQYSYAMGSLEPTQFDGQYNLKEENVTVRDYLSAAGIDRRHTNNTRDGAVNLEKTVNANIGNLTNEAYDNKYVINFAAFNTNNAVRNATGGSGYNKFRQFESMWAFNTKGYKRVYVHTDQESTELSGTRGDFANYINGNADYKKLYLTQKYILRNKNNKKAREFGPYVQKDVLDPILNNNANFSSQGKEESLLKNGNLDILLNNNIRLQSYKISKNGNQTQNEDNPTANFINLKNIALGVGESLELNYKIILDQSASNNEDHIIHSRMNYKADNQTSDLDPNKMTTRRNASTPATFTVSHNTPDNGTLSVSPTKAKAGDIITVTAKPKTNYKLKYLYYRDGNGNQVDIVGNSFEMPAANVTVFAEFEQDTQPQPTEHTITSYTDGKGNSVTASVSTATKDQTINLQATINKDYTLEGIWIEDQAGNKIQDVTNYSFRMPDKNVFIKANFKKKPQAKTYYVSPTIEQGKGRVVVNPTSDMSTGFTKAAEGEKVTFSIRTQAGWQVKKDSVYAWKSDGKGKVDDLVFDGVNGSFTMPNTSVTINVTFETEKIPADSYVATVDPTMTGGNISVSQRIVKAGERVRFTISPWDGYKNTAQSVLPSQGGTPVKVQSDEQGYYFIMPKSNVTVSGTFVKDTNPGAYKVTIGQTQHGRVYASPTSANANDEVTLSALADKGYVFDSYSVTDASGQNVQLTGNKFTMPASAVSVSANFKYVGDEITTGSVAQITNKQIGLELKVHKKNRYDANLANAIFNIWKANDKYEKQGNILATGVSDENGLVEFKDKEGHKVNLPKGKYVLEEAFAPLGYKKPTSPWKLDIVEENGKLVAKYNGPEETTSSYLASEKAKDVNNTGVTTNVNGIKYSSRLTRINTEGKTYVQRIYIDTRDYVSTDPNNKENIVNVQIKPKYKREEIDTPGQPPVTIKDGVKTAYRSTYEIIGLAKDPTQAQITDILQNYDVSKKDVRSVNTARWRPFDWGFDEDQLNLKPGVYFIDVEGFYDDVIITGESDKNDKYTITGDDLGKIDLNVDFFDGARQFEQLVFDKNTSSFESKAFEGASYQGGIEAVRQRYEDRLYANYISQGYDAQTSRQYAKYNADQWANAKETGQKYKRALSKKATLNRTEYTGGYIVPSIDGTPASHIPTRIDISSLYSSSKTNTVPQEGMTITNDDETYNITFSKHGKDSDDATVEEITKRRLEGGVFKLQRKVREDFYEDVEGSTVASAFNGYFGFRGLKPGRYRLMEVQAPKGYKPIEGPLLYFTVETVSLISDKIADPRTGQYIKMSDVDYYFPTSTDPYTLGTTAHKFDTLKMKDPTDSAKEILLKDARNVDLETSKIINPENNQEVLFKDMSIKFPELKDKDGNPLTDSAGKPLKDTYRISELQITPKSNGYISLEYDKANGVYQYVPEKSTSEKDGKLVDYVTSATAKNMGKIINTKPGKGEVTINKVDENGKALVGTANDAGTLVAGAKFKLTNTLTGDTEEKFVGTDGTLKFTGLKIGTYKLEEISSPDGHINTDQEWHFTVGGKTLDPYTADIAPTGRNLTDKITLTTNKVSVLNPKDKTSTEVKEGSEIHPHIGESLEFDNNFKIDPSVKINPGDYFVVNLTNNIDLNGVFEDEADNLDIFADGVGTIAKAKYDKKNGTITYIFTDYAKSYNLLTFSNKITAFINLYENKKSAGKISVGMNVGSSTTNNKDIKLVYDLDMLDYKDYEGNNLNMTSKIVKYNPITGEFVHYYYVNRLRTSLKRSEFQFSSDQYIDNLVVRKLKLKDNSTEKIEEDMPESFGINEASTNLKDDGVLTSISRLTPGYYDFGYLEDIGPNDSYILKVTGRVANTDKTKYNGYGRLAHYHGNEVIIEGHRYDQVYAFTNDATAKAELTIQAVNPANKIKFKKVNDRNEALKDATFIIQSKNSEGNWNAYGQPAKSDNDGLFEFTKLPKGEYRLLETEAPTGYDTPKDPLVEFKVDDKGVIYRLIPVRDKNGKIKKDANGKIETTEVEEPGIIPIDIVNTSTKEIEFKKVDAGDNTKALAGAEFEIWFKKSKDLEYKKDNLKLYEKKDKQGTVTDRIALSPDETKPDGFEEVTKFVTGEDGIIKFKFKEPGYYALKETKAPKGFIPPRDYVKEFVLKDGQILEDNYRTEMSVDKSVGGIWANGWYDTYDTSINFKFNPNGEEITYTKGKSKLSLSGLPYNTDHWDKFYAQTGISISVYKFNEAGKRQFIKTIELDKERDYTNDKGTKEIDLYELLKPDGHTDDKPFKSSQKLEFSMSSKLSLTKVLELKSKIEIGEGADKISEDRTYAIGTEGDKKVEHSFSFSSLGELISPFNIENKKAEYPSTGGMGTFIFTSIGASLIGLAYLSYRRRRGLVFDE
ncbi:SpaA isopeptide-forming pilin-related protein [Peptoniphilus duerdenii]|uniref:SpaA isopeptide-forming pilin-related protein n=1 Tax=Peptoniphilus duerdenii TaxID=507750 RepID=UPI00288AAA21|nr:SpaA isopeptide-forming pilin-related protein [Peptoniphilus duerdenii]